MRTMLLLDFHNQILLILIERDSIFYSEDSLEFCGLIYFLVLLLLPSVLHLQLCLMLLFAGPLNFGTAIRSLLAAVLLYLLRLLLLWIASLSQCLLLSFSQFDVVEVFIFLVCQDCSLQGYWVLICLFLGWFDLSLVCWFSFFLLLVVGMGFFITWFISKWFFPLHYLINKNI